MMRRPWDIIAFQDPPDEMSFMSVVKASGYRLLTQSYVPLTEELHPSFKKASSYRGACSKHIARARRPKCDNPGRYNARGGSETIAQRRVFGTLNDP